jgi:hypothetical protein
MAPINTRNVYRSNALMGHPYGTDFVYDEMMVAGTAPQLRLPPSHDRSLRRIEARRWPSRKSAVAAGILS